MTVQFLSVDAGNGGTNGVKANEKSTPQVYFPSVRAAATGDTLGLGEEFELEYEYVDWGGHRYVYGDDVIRISRRAIERHQGKFRYGNEFHKFLVATAAAKLGIHQGEVDLTLFAPPGIYVEAKATMQEQFMQQDGQVAIQLKTDKKLRTWQYSNLTIYPEGIGAAACFAIDADGQPIPDSKVLDGDTAILDMGMYTLDALKMSDGNFNPESLSTATWEEQGIKAHILDPLLRQVKKQGDDFSLLTVDDIDSVIREGLQTGDYRLRVAGKELNLKSLLDKYSERYAEWIANSVLDGVFNGLRGIRSCILVGGGAVLTEDYLHRWYASKLLRFDQSEITSDIEPVYANAIGGIRLAKMRELKNA
jgi:hypothetical protein